MIVHSWILNSVSESISQSILFMENKLDLQTYLKEQFSKSDLVYISELVQEIYGMQQDFRSMIEYSDLKILWEEIKFTFPILHVVVELTVHMKLCAILDNVTYIIFRSFFSGLNANFSMVKSQILLMDPLAPMNKIFSMVLQHERQWNISPFAESKSSVNVVDSQKFNDKTYGS